MHTHHLSKPSRLFLVIIFLLALTAFPCQVGRASADDQNTVYTDDFEDGQALDWQLEPGWSVLSDSGNHVLAGQGHAWATLGQSFTGDLRVSFRVKLLKGRIHLVISLTEASRYFIGFDAGGTDLNKQYFPDDFHEGLASGGGTHGLNRWYQVEFVLQGSRIDCFVDEIQVWSYTDPQPLPGGAIAFETQDDSQAYVDDIQVQTGTVTAIPPTLAQTATSIPTTTQTAVSTPARLPPASLAWVRTGGPLGGLGYDIRMRPDDLDIMYVTDSKAGVFKSTDGGNTWVPKNNGITARQGNTGDEIPVFCLTIDPNDYDTLWVGTQSQRGFFKSTDGGETWKKMDNGVVERGLTTRGFGVDPQDSDVVYAAGEVSSWEWAGVYRLGREFEMVQGVVYKTTDGGQVWKKVWQGDNLARYIWIDPRDSNVLYVSTGIFDREAANSDVLHHQDGGVGVIKSTDGGETWQQVNNGLQNLYVGSLFMDQQNPDILLAGTGTAWGSPGAGVYLTVDGGQTWKQTLSVGLMIESVEFSTTDPAIAYAGGYLEVYKSGDGGHTWTLVSGGEQENDQGWGPAGIFAGHPIDFQLDPRDPDRLFSNQYGGGNFLSLDGGRTWQPASKGYTGAAVRDIVVDPTQPGRVIVAARSGIFASDNGGEDWTGLSFRPFYSLDWHVVAVDPSNPLHLLAGMTCWRNLVSSSDGGMSWHEVQKFSNEINIAFDTIAFAPSNSNIVYAGSAGFISCGHFTSDVPSSGFNATVRKPGEGVYMSFDGGEHWYRSGNPLIKDLSISRLAVDPQDASIVYAATFYHGLFHSTNSGQSWSQVLGGLPADKSITTVSIDPHDSSIIFAGRNQAGLYGSNDGGATWRQVSAGLPPEGVITDVVFDPQNSQVLFAAEAFSGVYRSQDGGKTWQALNNGLNVRSFNALAISADGLHLYAASESSGVFRLDLDGRAPQPVPTPTPEPTSSPIPTSSPAVTISPTSGASTLSPTATPGGRPGICAGAVLLPFALVGLVWRQAARKRRG
jgi:photosystem II stability/assembly factor-like uncharacterized protein